MSRAASAAGFPSSAGLASSLHSAEATLSQKQPGIRRRFAVTLKPRLKTEVQRKLLCRVVKGAESTASPATKYASDETVLLSLSQLRKSLSEDSPVGATESRHVDGAKLLVGGAAAAALAAAGIQLGSQVVQAVESVPVVANLEMLLGTVVTAQSVLSYLGDKKTRSKVDAKLVSLLGTLKAAFGQRGTQRGSKKLPTAPEKDPEAPVPARAGRREPSMLEVELRSLVDTASVKPSTATAMTVDRPTFIGSVADFIRTREQQTLAEQDKLEGRVESSQVASRKLLEVEEAEVTRETEEEQQGRDGVRRSGKDGPKPTVSRRTRASAEAAAALAKLMHVQGVQKQLKAERSRGLKEVTGLQADLGTLSLSARRLAQRKQGQFAHLPRSVADFLGIPGRKEGQGAAAGPGSLSAEFEDKLQSLRKLGRSASKGALGKPGPKTEVLALQQQLGCLEMQLQMVSDSRDSLLESNAELHRRVAQVTAEKQALAHRVQQLEGSLAQARAATKAAAPPVLGLETLLWPANSSQAASKKEGVWTAQAALEAELRSALEGRNKYQGAVKWLGLQLEIVAEGDQDREAHLRSSLEFAEKRAREEESRVGDIRARLSEWERKSLVQQSVLADRVAGLEAKVARLSVTEGANQSPLLTEPLFGAPSPLQKRPSTGPLGSGRGGNPLAHAPLPSMRGGALALAEAAPAAVAAAAASSAAESSAAESAAEWLQDIRAKVQEGERRPRGKPKREALIAPMTQSQLKAYASAIFPAYVTPSSDTQGQRREVEALVKDLVKKGAAEDWARNLLANELLPAATAKQISGGNRKT